MHPNVAEVLFLLKPPTKYIVIAVDIKQIKIVASIGLIPYKIIGGVRFYDRKEVKDVLAILKVLMNERDRVSLERIAKNVLSGLGDASLSKVFSAMEVLPDVEPLKNPDLPDVLSGKAKKSFEKLVNFLKNTSVDLPPAEIVQKVISYFDFDSLLRDGTPTGEERIENLGVMTGNAMQYEALEDFLADATLMSSADESSANDSVTLMTMHAAKGLEFPVVFLVGMEDGLFPSSRAEDEASLEEERRLAYVGMTRAMKKLFLTYAASRFSFGNRSYGMPSRFLMELGYNPYGSNQYNDNDAYDDDNDGFKDYYDEFPDDELPIYE